MIICVILSTIGLILCVALNVLSYWEWGIHVIGIFPEWSAFALGTGIFLVGIPSLIVSNREKSSFHTPMWMNMLVGATFAYAMFSLIVRIVLLGNNYVEERNGLYVLTRSGNVVRELTAEEYQKYSGHEGRALTGVWMTFYAYTMTLTYRTFRTRRVVHSDAWKEFLEALMSEDPVVGKQAASCHTMHGSQAIRALLHVLKHPNNKVQRYAILKLRESFNTVQAVVFGQHTFKGSKQYHMLYNPDVSSLTVPMSHIKRIIVETATYDMHLVERFLTYALNYIGQKHLKKHVEVHIYGDPGTLHPNLRNNFENLCKWVEVHAEEKNMFLLLEAP